MRNTIVFVNPINTHNENFNFNEIFKTMKTLIRFLFVIMLITLPIIVPKAAAQPPPPPPLEIPIDGGLTFLLIAGMAYGAKKIVENKSRFNT